MTFRDYHKHDFQINYPLPWKLLLAWNDVNTAAEIMQQTMAEDRKDKGIKPRDKFKIGLERFRDVGRLYANALDLPKSTSELISIPGYQCVVLFFQAYPLY